MAIKKLESIAARMPDRARSSSARSRFPGQLMVVWAKTTAPSLVNEKLVRKEYREVYLDLNSASMPESRHFVTDLGADGLRSPAGEQAGTGRCPRPRRQEHAVRRQLA